MTSSTRCFITCTTYPSSNNIPVSELQANKPPVLWSFKE